VREDPYANEELAEGEYLYEDGSGEFEKYDFATEPFKEED